jgi:hypothetical protein
MPSASRHMRILLAGPVLAVLALATPCAASILWFDETDGGRSNMTFDGLVALHDQFKGEPAAMISFDLLEAGTVLGDQYAESLGVTFENTAVGRYAQYAVMYPEGGAVVEDVTGYDGTYMPDGDMMFVKWDNHLADSPFAILFDRPVLAVGAFLGMGVQGDVHTLTVTVYDVLGDVLGQRTIQSWLWESDSYRQNYETFFGVRADEPQIARVEIRNDSDTDFANALILDNVWFDADPAPEPAGLTLMIAASLMLLCRRTRRRRRA